MQVRLKPDTKSRLNGLVAKTGRSTADLIEDTMAGYLAEVVETRKVLDGRYDDVKSGRVQPIDGEQAFARLRRKSKERRSSRS
jgi:predicted DNA-binding protein